MLDADSDDIKDMHPARLNSEGATNLTHACSISGDAGPADDKKSRVGRTLIIS
jgi:hypothetical protein